MTKNIFLSLFLILGFALVYVLYRISEKLGNGRYQFENSITIHDTKTGTTYRRKGVNGEGWIMVDEKGKNIEIASRPIN